MFKKEIINKLSLTNLHISKLESYVDALKEYNSHTNLVGKSTLENPWKNHVLDSLQILPFIKSKKLSILDMGTGAGLPGLALNILGCENVTLVDSNGKKITFLIQVKKDLNLNARVILSRLENLEGLKFDVLTSRALANLDKLLSYSQKFIKKNTVLIFLKGKAVNDELLDAQKNWKFSLEKKQSVSDQRGTILIIKDLKKK